jgi:hypothetical protein
LRGERWHFCYFQPTKVVINYCLKKVFLLPLLCLSLIFCPSCEKGPKVTGPPEKITIAYPPEVIIGKRRYADTQAGIATCPFTESEKSFG